MIDYVLYQVVIGQQCNDEDNNNDDYDSDNNNDKYSVCLAKHFTQTNRILHKHECGACDKFHVCVIFVSNLSKIDVYSRSSFQIPHVRTFFIEAQNWFSVVVSQCTQNFPASRFPLNTTFKSGIASTY